MFSVFDLYKGWPGSGSTFPGYQRFLLARGKRKYFASLRLPEAVATIGEVARKSPENL